MAITIRELLASDTISQAADKINFNFDQLLLNGGGPQGPQGPQGPPGPIGGRGIRGSVWYEDTSTTSPGNNPNTVPPTLTPEDEDNYLQFNGVVWTYDASIPAWVPTNIDLTGPVGPPGASGKFAEYGTSPYNAAGDTTIFPDEMSFSANPLNRGVRSVLIGGFPENPAFTPTFTGTNIVPLAIASQLQMPDISMMVHQFNAAGRGIVFHGGDATENFEQSLVANLSSIRISNDDLMVITVPKVPTVASIPPDLDGLRVLTLERNQHFQAGKRIWLQAGTSSTQYGAGDLASVWIETDRNDASIPDPTIELRVDDTAGPGYDAELRLGGFNTTPGTSSKQGDFWVAAGLIDILSNGNTTVNSGQGITMDAVNNIVATSSSADIRLNAPFGELFSTSQMVDVNATTSIEIDAGTSIEIDAATTMLLESTTSTEVLSAGEINIHSNTADVNIFTDTGTGGDVLIDTSTTGSQIRLRTTGDTSPINLITNGLGSNIQILANLGEIDISAFIVDIDALSIDIDGGGFTVDTNTVAITSLVNDITLTSARDIILKHGSGDEVLIQPTSGGPEVNLKPASGDDVSEINIYHNSGGGNSSLILRSDDSSDEGQVVVSPGMSLRLTDGNTVGDQVIVEAYRSGSDLAPADFPTFRVDANIHYSGGPKAFARDEYLFASGRYNQNGVGFSMEVLWQKVGNVVSMNGTIARTAPSTATTGFNLPVLADGTFVGYRLKGSAQSNDGTALAGDRIANIELTSGAGSSTFKCFPALPSTAIGDTWSFTGSYLLIP